MNVFNLPALLLDMYDTCLDTNIPSVCRDSVVSKAQPLVNTYLSSFEICRDALDTPTCIKVFAPDPTPQAIPFILLGIGIGYLFSRRK